MIGQLVIIMCKNFGKKGEISVENSSRWEIGGTNKATVVVRSAEVNSGGIKPHLISGFKHSTACSVLL